MTRVPIQFIILWVSLVYFTYRAGRVEVSLLLNYSKRDRFLRHLKLACPAFPKLRHRGCQVNYIVRVRFIRAQAFIRAQTHSRIPLSNAHSVKYKK